MNYDMSGDSQSLHILKEFVYEEKEFLMKSFSIHLEQKVNIILQYKKITFYILNRKTINKKIY